MNEKVNDVKDKVLDKADALCSKLPLDQINQKLGGKFDVKSKKVRLIFGGAILALIAIIVVIICAVFGSPSLTDDEFFEAQLLAANKFEASDITNIKYAATEEAIGGADALIFNAECMRDGKVAKIKIIVIRSKDVVDVATGHYDPKEWGH